MSIMLKKYNQYKSSGSEWLGDIPTHWEVKKLKYLVRLRRDRLENSDFIISVENIEGWTGKLVGLENEKNFQGEISAFEKGDILFNKLRPYLGKVYLANRNGGCFGELLILQPSNEIESNYLYYKISSFYFIDAVDSSTYGTKMPRASWEDFISQQLITLPPQYEQQKIAQYLDTKTIEIDDLIQKKQKLIALLREERTTLINQAVTKGVDTEGVAFKDSGIEWLGDIPEHWAVKKLKYVGKMKSGDTITADSIRDEGDYSVFGGNGLRGFTNNYTHEGDFVLIGRQGALCGNINYANEKFWASEHAIVVNHNQGIEVVWLGELLRAMNLNQYSQSAAQPGLAVEKIINLHVPVPPQYEQQKIVEYIEKETQRIDELIGKIETEISLMQEYRTALISEVVTGKVRVVD
jgi:type I restriction enzyme, S subunit